MLNTSPILHAARLACACVLMTASLPAAATAAVPALPPAVTDALREAQLPAAHAAFFVQRVDADRPLLVHNGSKRMNPASTMKLVTTYAALELLGPAHTWKTQALADAPPRDGVLGGNLYLKGSGDPGLTLERFWLLLRQLRARGVTTIAGDLVLDRSEFRLPPHDPAAFDNEPLRPYNAGPDALLTNFKSLRLTLVPDPAARTVQRSGQPVDLSAREFGVLLALVEVRPRVLSRSQIEAKLYNWDNALDSNAIEVHVHHLRRKLGDACIRTLRGVGYFVPEDRA